MRRYNPAEIEPKWQQVWQDQQAFAAVDNDPRPKTYISPMFPYPSGAGMHTGHAFEHSIVDAIARFHRQHGHNVMNPMGWDAFGLPTENYAIKTGTSPVVATETFIDNFKRQIKRLGSSIDWAREINTSSPEYYKWTQWIFTEFYKRGLAYQKEALQWWCPVDKTVLANEQVEGGHCWRCGTLVEKKSMKQWFFKITDYADELLEEIDDLDWPQKIKTAQTNWIGKSVGAEIKFKLDIEYKDSLKFTPELTEKIIAGEKTSTIRLEAKELTVGDYAEFITRDGEVVTSFGAAKITNVRTLALRDIPNDLEGHEAYETEQQKLDDYVKYYGADVTLDTSFTIYNFSYIDNVITVFSTRPDTIFGATFVVLAPEHSLAKVLATGDFKDSTEAYIKAAVKKSEIERTNDTKEKTGVFSGSYAINPVSGEKVPVWVADYVLGGYGTGAVMGVPAHDERDYAFAEKFKLPVIEVVEKPTDSEEQVFHGEGVLINSGDFDGQASSDAREAIVAWLEENELGAAKTTYKMRDWLISRQRYWGAPIPIIHCEEHGAVAVPEDQLPVVLPEVEDFAPRGDGQSTLARATEWVNTTCPECGKPAKRETDTMDGYACSSWYLLRYSDPNNSERAWDPEKINYWNPVDFYVGGDHAVAHLLYVRFWSHVFSDMGLVDFKEPVKKLVYHGYINAEDGTKMSKSKGNVIDPLEVIDQGYGADALRTYLLFMGPIELDASWDSRGIGGIYRFLNRVWTLVQQFDAAPKDVTKNDDALRVAQHKTIRKVTNDIRRLNFNTAIAALMEYVNDLYKFKIDGYSQDAWHDALKALVQMIEPFAPHMANELWEQLGGEGLVQNAGWPAWDEALTVEDVITIAVQVNGKLRGEIQVGRDTDPEEIKAQALAHENVARFVTDEPKKVIYVPGRLVSVVV